MLIRTKQAQSAYKSTFIDKSTLPSVEVSLQDVNEAVAKQMNLIKVSFSLGNNNIILPPTDSKFTLKKKRMMKYYLYTSNLHVTRNVSNLIIVFWKNTSILDPRNHSIQTKEKENYFSKASGHQKH